MKKSSIWLSLIPLCICAALLTGLFVGRITAGDRIQAEKPDATAPEKTEQENTFPPEAPDTIININTADAETLAMLPGIGPSIAQRIVDHRKQYGPFYTVEELMDVNGIGQKLFDKIFPYITTGG